MLKYKKSIILIIGFIILLAMWGYPSKKSTSSQRKKDWLYLNFTTEPSTVDFRRTTEGSSVVLSDLIFDGLMRKSPSGKLEYAQAERIEISDDRKTYTFFLRDSFWSNGEPVTAQDFLSAWLQILDPKFPSPPAYFLYCIKNAQAAKQGTVPLSAVGIHAPDKKIFVVELEEPAEHFLNLITSYPFRPMRDPSLANGPFMLASWAPNSKIKLKKNPFYHLADRVQCAGIEFSLIPDPTTALDLWRKNELDILGIPCSPLPLASLPTLLQQERPKTYSLGCVCACNFNTRRFPFSNSNIRKAFSLSIPRVLLAEALALPNRSATSRLIAPCLLPDPMFTPNQITQEHSPQDFLEKGLQEEGESLPLQKIKLSYLAGPMNEENRRIVQILQQEWSERLGVVVLIEPLDVKLLGSTVMMGDFDIFISTWMPSYPDPMTFLVRFLSAQNIKNYTGWESPLFKELLQQSSRQIDPTKRTELLCRAEDVLLSEAPIAPMLFFEHFTIVQPWVKHSGFSPMGRLDVETLRLED